MNEPVGPVDATKVPRYAGPSTFARLPRLEDVGPGGRRRRRRPVRQRRQLPPGRPVRPGAHPAELAAAAALQPGARRLAVRAPSRSPTPATSPSTRSTSTRRSPRSSRRGKRCSPQRHPAAHARRRPHHRAAAAARDARQHGPLAVLHFDAHLDTWDTYFGEPYTHGTPFRRASEEGLLDREHCLHVGHPRPALRRAPTCPSRADLGFADRALHRARDASASRRRSSGCASASATGRSTCRSTSTCSTRRIAPGTGTPEAGGLTSRELLGILRGLRRARRRLRRHRRGRARPTTTPRSPASPPRTSATSCCRCLHWRKESSRQASDRQRDETVAMATERSRASPESRSAPSTTCR